MSATKNQLIEQYENNLTGFSNKEIQDVLLPKTFQELQEIVSKANKEGNDLYVISTGKNWGLGSKQPVVKKSIVLDLKNLDKIIEVNDRFRYAIIEPGVTQNQLSEYLRLNFPQLKLPVTGSAKETSIIGNMQERGAVAFGHRNHMIVAMEVLLLSGRIVRTGFWHYFKNNNAMAFHYANGHGADLRGLFIQSNLAITTKMVVRLQHQTKGVIILLMFKEIDLKKVTDNLRLQYEKELLDDGIVITNLNDPRTTKNKEYEYSGDWLAIASFSGEKSIVKAKKKILRKEFDTSGVKAFFVHTDSNPFSFRPSTLYPFVLNGINNSKWLYDRLSKKTMKSGETLGNILQRFAILKDFYKGIPTNFSIETMAKMNDTILDDDDLDNTNTLGLSCVLPAVPFEGESALAVSKIVNEVSLKWGVKPFHNLASIDELSFEGFYRIYFDRKEKKEVEIAHNWNKELHQVLKEKGYLPYRIDNERLKDFVDESDAYWQTMKNIKEVLDVNNVLSKGKYNIK